MAAAPGVYSEQWCGRHRMDGRTEREQKALNGRPSNPANKMRSRRLKSNVSWTTTITFAKS